MFFVSFRYVRSDFSKEHVDGTWDFSNSTGIEYRAMQNAPYVANLPSLCIVRLVICGQGRVQLLSQRCRPALPDSADVTDSD